MNNIEKQLHVAMIMDRNGEWARRRGLSRVMGHREGVKAIKRVVKAAGELNIGVLSLFAFSTENWLRPKDEVSFLMKLMEEYIAAESQELVAGGVRVVVSGRLDRIPTSTMRAAQGIVDRSAAGSKLVLNIALDYGGQDDIVQAAAKIAKAAVAGEIDAENLTADLFRSYLCHPELPDIDLLIRTGQEQRISNFMLWQLAYAELYFTPALWPDFGKDELAAALEDFRSRKRRFGMTQEQIDNKG